MVDSIRIGMAKSDFMAQLPYTQATAKTKQFIENFWNTDKDGKITNEIEFAMLNSWINGSERVKMPTKGEKLIKKSPPNLYGSYATYYTSKSGSKDTFNVFDNTMLKTPSMTVTWESGPQDKLFDSDGDGYADCRMYKEDSNNLSSPSYQDINMDGNLISSEILYNQGK